MDEDDVLLTIDAEHASSSDILAKAASEVLNKPLQSPPISPARSNSRRAPKKPVPARTPQPDVIKPSVSAPSGSSFKLGVMSKLKGLSDKVKSVAGVSAAVDKLTAVSSTPAAPPQAAEINGTRRTNSVSTGGKGDAAAGNAISGATAAIWTALASAGSKVKKKIDVAAANRAVIQEQHASHLIQLRDRVFTLEPGVLLVTDRVCLLCHSRCMADDADGLQVIDKALANRNKATVLKSLHKLFAGTVDWLSARGLTYFAFDCGLGSVLRANNGVDVFQANVSTLLRCSCCCCDERCVCWPPDSRLAASCHATRPRPPTVQACHWISSFKLHQPCTVPVSAAAAAVVLSFCCDAHHMLSCAVQAR